jgi:hypothetical protein
MLPRLGAMQRDSGVKHYYTESLVGMPVGIFHSGILVRAVLVECYPNGFLFRIGNKNPHPWIEGALLFLSKADFIAIDDLDKLK